MVYDKKKILPLDIKRLTISFLNGNRDQKNYLRRKWDIIEYHMRGQLDLWWLSKGGQISIQFVKDGRSQSAIGLDGLGSYKERQKASMQINNNHAKDHRIILHESTHMIGCKHQHDEAKLLKDSDRFGVNVSQDVDSITRYRQAGEKRNYYLSLGDIDFLHRYDEFRAIGEQWRRDEAKRRGRSL